MKRHLARLVGLLLLALPFAASAQEPGSAPSVVRGYFAALARKDFDGALELTQGAAQTRTAHMVGTLERQAAEHHAQVELKVKRLEVAETPSASDQPVPVTVTFDIDVIGSKWIFSKVARTLAGTARFTVAADEPRIIAIDGQLE